MVTLKIPLKKLSLCAPSETSLTKSNIVLSGEETSSISCISIHQMTWLDISKTLKHLLLNLNKTQPCLVLEQLWKKSRNWLNLRRLLTLINVSKLQDSNLKSCSIMKSRTYYRYSLTMLRIKTATHSGQVPRELQLQLSSTLMTHSTPYLLLLQLT